MLRRLGATISRALEEWGSPADAGSTRGLAFRLGLVLPLALLTLILFPPAPGYEVPNLRVGIVSSGDVLAPFDFPVLRDEQELERLRDQASLSVPPVYSHRPARADSALAALDAFLDRFEEVGPDTTGLAQLGRLEGRGTFLSSSHIEALLDDSTRESVRSSARRALPELYSNRLFASEAMLSEIASTQVTIISPDGTERVVHRDSIVALRPEAFAEGRLPLSRAGDSTLRQLIPELLPALMPPSVEPHPALTAIRRSDARRAIDPVRSEVLAGELIVSAHTRVTEEQAEILRSLEAEFSARRAGFTVDDARAGLGSLLMTVALILLFGFFLFLYRDDVFSDHRALGVLSITWGLVVGLTALFASIDAIPIYAAPIALGSIIVAVLWDARLSVVYTLFLAVYLGTQVDAGLPLVWTGIVSGLAGAWSVRRFRRRTQFYETLLFIIVGHTIALVALALSYLWGWSEFGIAISWAALSAAVSVFLAMGLMPVLEWASARTTDLTLLELADLNRPLLKQLLLEAPGTYHHSIIVGNLAESAVEGIGANSLLARVGAYYHDIGKVRRPEYFVENQRRGVNPHTALPPEASARIVSRHVTDGVEMAHAAGLPECVIDFIREHHGTTRLTYFFHKAEEQGAGNPTPSDFVYPGPRPRSKETAVVMLADSVEAACRVIEDPDADRLRQVVRRIVEMKLDEHQLDDADLTFQDLAVVRESFVSVLEGIHHHRIDYPAVSLHAPEVHGGSPDSVSSTGQGSV